MAMLSSERIGDAAAAAGDIHAATTSLVGECDAFKYLLFRIGEVAPTMATVLLLGETGTGKSLIAQAIHQSSPQRNGRFVAVNCAALPTTLLESELFGHERGAFTDARTSQTGRVEIAHRGTIFLDEVGELPLDAQAKLLRFLQEGEFERLGSHLTRRVEVRVIAATNRDIHAEVQAGRFRRDLYFRLNVFPITVPPLRARRRDVPLLTRYLVSRFAQRIGRRIDHIPAAVVDHLQHHTWPGNIRELENVLERAVIVSRDGTLRLDLPDEGVSERPMSDALVDVERAHIGRILAMTAWRVEGRHGAAAVLGLKPSTLRSRMKKLGIRRALELAHRAPSSASVSVA
jgi:transcriptional regulator with GAF, ATPase, and Fis domain